ncbi:MAG TPA: hypothetical protein PKA10_09505 [Selenomonadales bacterium]|nr:hypothetical protein [Selenomonadales bacterium]
MACDKEKKRHLIATPIINQEEINTAMRKLSEFRAPYHPPPTENEVVEMLIRIKKRWNSI